MRQCLVTCFAFVMLVAPATAEEPAALSTPVLSYRAQQGDTAARAALAARMQDLLTWAEAGDVDAQVALAEAYHSGQGMPGNEKVALDWYRRAAEQGDLRAQLALVEAYGAAPTHRRWKVPRDLGEAARWARRAAETGDASMQYRVAEHFQHGVVVQRDVGEAVRWYRLAAEQGHAEAQYALGRAYAEGDGVAADPAAAARWYQRAAEQDSGPAQKQLALCYQQGRGVLRDDTKAARWLLRAAERGDSEAQFLLGCCYVVGRGVPQDLVEASVWLTRATARMSSGPDADPYFAVQAYVAAQLTPAERAQVAQDQRTASVPSEPTPPDAAVSLDDATAQYAQGVLYIDGLDDPARGLSFLEAAAEAGHVAAQRRLGKMNQLGQGVPQDPSSAAQWYRRAAEQGDRHAQVALAEAYAAGEGVAQSDAEAVSWYRRAAELGSPLARYRLGMHSLLGLGVPLDLVEAHTWFNLLGTVAYDGQLRDLLEDRMSGQQLADANDRASRWYAEHAPPLELPPEMERPEDPEAQFRLGTEYAWNGDSPIADAIVAYWYRAAAEQGHTDAADELANLYWNGGRGLLQHYGEAAQWWRRAAADPRAAYPQVFLGNLYYMGWGVEQDDAEAMRLFRAAAENGLCAAEYIVGLGYVRGTGGPRDQAAGALWLRRAAEQGYVQAQLALGCCHVLGHGAPQDLVEAHLWFSLAAARDLPSAATLRALVAAHMTPAQVAAAEQHVRESSETVRLGSWRDSSCHATFDSGSAPEVAEVLDATGVTVLSEGLWAQYVYGWMEAVVFQDGVAALPYLAPVAAEGYAPAQRLLSHLYAHGNGMPPDGEQAVHWYRLAAEQGDAEAAYALGGLYAQGDLVPADAEEALAWYRRAAERGHAEAQVDLGLRCAQGVGAPVDFVEAYRWLSRADAQGQRGCSALCRFLETRLTATQLAEAKQPAKTSLEATTIALGGARVQVRE